MGRFTWLAGALALAAWGAAGALGGCGSSDEGSADAGDEGSSTSSSGSSAPSGPSDASIEDGAGSVNDGGGSSGSGQSNPGAITCGAASCGPGSGSICCERRFMDGGGSQTCEATCEGFGTYEVRCDEKADCQSPADKCCLQLGGAKCDNNCGFGNTAGIQLCKTSAECGDAGACAEKTCFNRKRFVCGSPIGCQ